jgi:hypothetical protein
MARARLSQAVAELSPSRGKVPKPITKFTIFSELPTELRIIIWKLTMAPRTIAVKIREIGSLESIEWPLVDMYSPTPVPTALQVCRESRLEALYTYQLSFGTVMISRKEKDDHFSFIRSPQTYFSYEMDTAHFEYIGKTIHRQLPVAYLTDKDLANIRHVRADWVEGVSERLIKQIIQFKKLESFALCWYWKDGLDPKEAGPVHDEIKVTEANYQSLQDRPDILQFMDSFITARDVYAPGFNIPLLIVRSINNDELCEQIFSMMFGHSSRQSPMLLGRN